MASVTHVTDVGDADLMSARPKEFLMKGFVANGFIGAMLMLGGLNMDGSIGLVCWVFASIFFLSAGYWYFRAVRSYALYSMKRSRELMSITPTSIQLEAARGVQPEVVKLILSEHRRGWMLKGGRLEYEGMRMDVLYEAPDVTITFFEYFLKNSSAVSVMPKRNLVDGRKNRFDPLGMVTEYEMYDKVIALLLREGKIHKWTEFDQVFSWVEPWTPSLVAEDYWLELDVDADEEVLVKA